MERLLKYMVISERQWYRYVANKGTLHLDHISGHYTFCNSEAMEAVMSSEELHHLSTAVYT